MKNFEVERVSGYDLRPGDIVYDSNPMKENIINPIKFRVHGFDNLTLFMEVLDEYESTYYTQSTVHPPYYCFGRDSIGWYKIKKTLQPIEYVKKQKFVMA